MASSAPSKVQFVPNRLRFGWFRPKEEGKADLSIHGQLLTEDVWDEMVEMTGVANKLRTFVVNFLGLVEDFHVLKSLEKEIGEELTAAFQEVSMPIPATLSEMIKAQRTVSHFVATSGAFQERSRARLKTMYGPKSDQLRMWEEEVSRLKLTSFAFRFCRALRNHSLHFDVPVSLVPVQARRDDAERLKTTARLELQTGVIQRNAGFAKHVLDELLATGSRFDLSLILIDSMRAYQNLMHLVLRLHEAPLNRMMVYGRALASHLKVPLGAVPVIWNCDDPRNGPPESVSIIDLGFEEALRLGTLRIQLDRILESPPARAIAADYVLDD